MIKFHLLKNAWHFEMPGFSNRAIPDKHEKKSRLTSQALSRLGTTPADMRLASELSTSFDLI